MDERFKALQKNQLFDVSTMSWWTYLIDRYSFCELIECLEWEEDQELESWVYHVATGFNLEKTCIHLSRKKRTLYTSILNILLLCLLWLIFKFADLEELVFVLTIGGRKGFVFVEQRSHWEFDKAKSKGDTAYHLSCTGEKWQKPLESGCSQFVAEYSEDILWSWSWVIQGVLAQVSGRRIKGRWD